MSSLNTSTIVKTLQQDYLLPFLQNQHPLLLLSEFVIGLSGLSYFLYNKFFNQNNITKPLQQIKKLIIYPIKSAKGIEVQEWPISKYGLLYDRYWMIVKENTMKLISQREIPKMCLLETNLKILEKNNCVLSVTFPNKGKKEMKWIKNLSENKIVKVSLWNDSIFGIDCGDEISDWLTDCLQQKVRLVQIIPDDVNVTDNYVTENSITSENSVTNVTENVTSENGDTKVTELTTVRKIDDKLIFNENISNLVTFPDGFPFLLLLENSVTDFNLKILKELNKNYLIYLFKKYILKTKYIEEHNFRPNILISNTLQNFTPTLQQNTQQNDLPYSEEQYKILTINNNITLYGINRCVRCTMPSVDFKIGKKNSYITDYLNKFRFDENVKGTIFGICCSHDKRDVGKVIKVGDVIEILERGEVP
ncbi:hypothetical protein ABK040_016354 [Willaertia magna]